MKKSKRQESGRSMIEMLGALALLVLLTLGGIQLSKTLQSSAIAKDLTTAVMEEVTITHHDLLARQDGRRHRTRIGPHGIQITAENGTSGNMNNYFWVELGEVSSTVCQKIVDKKDKLSTSAVRLVEIFSGHTKQVANCNENGSLVFLFQKGTDGRGTPTITPVDPDNPDGCPTVMCPVGAVSCADNVLTCGPGYKKTNCDNCNMTCEQCPANQVKETDSSSCETTCHECEDGQKANADQTACVCLDYGEQCNDERYADGNCNCVECLEDSHCGVAQICTEDHKCECSEAGTTTNCPDGTMSDGSCHCVECIQDTDCESNEYCDTSTYTCKLACTDGKSSYDKEEDKCVCGDLGGSYNRGTASTCYSCGEGSYVKLPVWDEDKQKCVCESDASCDGIEQCVDGECKPIEICNNFTATACITTCTVENHEVVYTYASDTVYYNNNTSTHKHCGNPNDVHERGTWVCDSGYVMRSDGTCKNGCDGFEADICTTECTSTGIDAVYMRAAEGTVCGTNKVCNGGDSRGVGSCVCDKGYELKSGESTCTPIATGWYKNTIGNTGTKKCADWKANTTTASTGSTSSSACVCKAGYTLSNGSCVQCSAGYYKNTIGNGACTRCSAGTYSSAGAASCTKCPAGKYSNAGASACTNCPAGKTSSAGASSCTNCPAGKYSAAGASSCTNCSAGTYSGAGASSCTNCPAGKTSSAGASSCTNCDAGTRCNCSGTTPYANGAGACVQCTVDSHCGSTQCPKSTIASCSACTISSYYCNSNKCVAKMKRGKSGGSKCPDNWCKIGVRGSYSSCSCDSSKCWKTADCWCQ